MDEIKRGYDPLDENDHPPATFLEQHGFLLLILGIDVGAIIIYAIKRRRV